MLVPYVNPPRLKYWSSSVTCPPRFTHSRVSDWMSAMSSAPVGTPSLTAGVADMVKLSM